MAVVDHGIPVISSRQWDFALSPNAAGTGWNFITSSYNYPSANPVEWPVVKDLTGTPNVQIYTTLSKKYPNSLYNVNSSRGQIRAQNGRIFFPLFLNYFAVYDPTTEQVTQIGPFVEAPPINPNQSTIPYSTCFDHAGQLYFATQESSNRPSCVVNVDPTTLAITVLGYVGSGALAGTTYGYYVIADTITASKYLYVAYGEDPWQLWALNIATGVATKLVDAATTTIISFTEVVGQGWTATVDGVRYWCLDGAVYPYTPGQLPPVAVRNVTPASNPLVLPPDIDASGGIGVVGWRPNGSVGAYTYVNYSVNFYNAITIESLVDSNDGIVGNAQQYQGFFQYKEPADTHVWFGPSSGVVSGGPRLNVSNTIYICGYPNGALYSFDPTQPYQTNVNPKSLGFYAPNGSLAGIKYADYVAWGSAAGASGRLFCAGSRERNGVGSGIGSWDHTTKAFAGIDSAVGMDTCLPDGLCVMNGLSQVVMSTHLITPPGTADLFIFDYNMNFVAAVPVINNLAKLGPIFQTTTPNVITGIVQGSGNSLGLWQYNVGTHTFIQYVELPVVGTIGVCCQRVGGSVWLMSGNNLVNVDVSNLTATVFTDLSAQAPVVKMSFGADPSTLFFAGAVNGGVSGAQLFSLTVGSVLAAGPFAGIGSIADATLKNAGAITLAVGPFSGSGTFNPVATVYGADPITHPGDDIVSLLNNESAAIVRGQPVYSDLPTGVRLACADGTGTSIVVGLVKDGNVPANIFTDVVVSGTITATTAQWDVVCGTVGGLTTKQVYYLHPTIPGRLTSVPPNASGKELVPVILALSPIKASVIIKPPILL